MVPESTVPNLDAGIYDAAPEILILLFVFIVGFWARGSVRIVLDSIAVRIRSGAAVQFGNFRLDTLRISNTSLKQPGKIESHEDYAREIERNKVYKNTQGTFIAVQLFPAEDSNQVYDILMYVVRHKEKVSKIARVEYYFGSAWNHRVFTSSDPKKRFAIVASAYGPFLCHARVHFKNGTHIETWRYVDFHTGILPTPTSDT